jgi:hypothetical protein
MKKRASKRESNVPGKDWLSETILEIQRDVREIKSDIRMLREHKAENHGKVMIVAALITLVINAIAIFLRL